MKKILLAIILFFPVFLPDAWAKVYIDLAAPAFRKLPIGVPEFKDLGAPAQGPAEKAEREAIKKNLLDAAITDLRFSGFFSVIDRAAYLEDPNTSGITAAETNFRNWRAIGADGVLKGGFIAEGDRLTVELRV